MKKYADHSGTSGIAFYNISEGHIDIKFKSQPSWYRYSIKSISKRHIETMKKLALKGEGLSTYISQHPEVRDHFEKLEP